MVQSLWWVLLWVILIFSVILGIIWLIGIHIAPPADNTGAAETFTSYSTPDFSNVAGFQFTNLPENEILIPKQYWLVNDEIAQIEYQAVPGHTVYLRTAPSGSLKLPKEYTDYDYERTGEYTIGETAVTQRASPGRRTLVTWTNDGFDYALYALEPEMNLIGGIVDDFVSNTAAAMATPST